MSLQNNFNSLMSAIRGIDKAKQTYKAKTEEINNNDMYSQDYKAKLVRDLQANTLEELSTLREIIDFAIPVIKSDLEQEESVGIDLADVRLTNAVTLISALGMNEIPERTQTAIIEPFIGNNNALNVLYPVLNQSGMYFAKELVKHGLMQINNASSFLDKVSDNAFYASSSTDTAWTMAEALQQAETFAKAHGLQMPGTL